MIRPSETINFELPAKAIGVCWKHASVKSESNGQSRPPKLCLWDTWAGPSPC